MSPFLVVSAALTGENTQQDKSSAKGNFKGTYIDLIVPKALLNFVKQAAVGKLAERCQVIVRSGRYQLDLGEK